MRVQSSALPKANAMPAIKFNSHPHREAKRIMRLLSRRGWRWADEPLLRQLTPLQIEALQDYIASRAKTHHSLALTARSLVLFALAAGALKGDFALGLWVATCEALLLLPFVLAARQYPYAVYALTQTNDVAALPTLIQATRHTWGRHPQIRAAILRLLEHVTEDHVGLLDDAEQKQLWIINVEMQGLSSTRSSETMLLTLHILAAIGSQTTLTRLKQLAHNSMWLYGGVSALEIVRELISLMEARLKRQQVSETLLRTANTPTNQPDTLLRAAHATTPEPTGQLLRASTGEEREL